MGCLNEQLGFFDEPVRVVLGHLLPRRLVCREQISGKLRSGERIVKELCIVEPLSELADNPRGIAVNVDVLYEHQRFGCLNHRLVRTLGSIGRFALPEYAGIINSDPAKRGLQLQHILTMSSGLEWDEESFPYSHAENDCFQMKS